MRDRGPDDFNMTVEDFAQWLLELPEEYKSRKIWFIDISFPYKGKALSVEDSPTKEFISIVDSHGD